MAGVLVRAVAVIDNTSAVLDDARTAPDDPSSKPNWDFCYMLGNHVLITVLLTLNCSQKLWK